MINPASMAVRIHFTDGTSLRYNYNRCFDVESFGRYPVDEMRRGDVMSIIHIDVAALYKWQKNTLQSE